jgi:hypothetical protein
MIWKLLHAIYDTNAPLPIDSETLGTALDDIEYFHVAPQFYQLLKRQGKLDTMPILFQERLKVKYDETVLLNVYIRYENEQIIKALEASGIPVIPIKGTHFAAKYFGHIGARSTSDIDLLLQPPDLSRAVDCIRALGFTYQERKIRSHFHVSFSKPSPGLRHSLTVELQWGLLMEGTSKFNVEELWRDAVPLKPYNHVMELSEYHTFYMICLHGWKHGLNSLKYLIDIVQLIQVSGDQIDYDRLFRDAGSHQTYRRLSSTLSVIYRQFPYLENQKPLVLPKRRGDWWDYDALRGKQQQSLKRYVRFLQYQCFDFDSPRHSFTALIHYVESLLNK